MRNESLESIEKQYTNKIKPDENLLDIRNSQSLVEIYAQPLILVTFILVTFVRILKMARRVPIRFGPSLDSI